MKKAIPVFMLCMLFIIGTAIAGGSDTGKITAKEVAEGVKDYIKSATNEGYFHIYDNLEGKDLNLKLGNVCPDKVVYIKSEDVYSDCVDFSTDDKTKYDIDFWMKKDQGDGLEIYTVRIHKKGDISRLNYSSDEAVPIK